MSFYTRFMPTFLNNCTEFEYALVNQLGAEMENCAASLGANYAYICKNLTNGYRPVTIAFYAEGGQFLGRRTPNTVAAA